jgi:hypothetical protein
LNSRTRFLLTELQRKEYIACDTIKHIYGREYRGEKMIRAVLLDTQPSDIWHDPFFQFGINIVIAVLAIIISSFVAVWIYKRQKSKREITYLYILS